MFFRSYPRFHEDKFTTPLPPMAGQASSPDIMMTSGDACPTRGTLYAIHRITRINKMKIPIQLNYSDALVYCVIPKGEKNRFYTISINSIKNFL